MSCPGGVCVLPPGAKPFMGTPPVGYATACTDGDYYVDGSCYVLCDRGSWSQEDCIGSAPPDGYTLYGPVGIDGGGADTSVPTPDGGPAPDSGVSETSTPDGGPAPDSGVNETSTVDGGAGPETSTNPDTGTGTETAASCTGNTCAADSDCSCSGSTCDTSTGTCT